jgi:hypothetical protein
VDLFDLNQYAKQNDRSASGTTTRGGRRTPTKNITVVDKE